MKNNNNINNLTENKFSQDLNDKKKQDFLKAYKSMNELHRWIQRHEKQKTS